MRLSIADIEAVIAVYDTRDYQAAANRLYISRSALQKRLKKAVEELGPLFISRKLHNSDAALLPLPHTPALVEALRNDVTTLEQTISKHREIPLKSSTMTIRLGIIENLEHLVVPLIEPVIRQEAPQLELISYGLTRNQKLYRAQDTAFAYHQLFRAETDICIHLDTPGEEKFNLVQSGDKINPKNSTFVSEELFRTDVVGIASCAMVIPEPMTLDFLQGAKKVVLSQEYLNVMLGSPESFWEVQSITTVARLVASDAGYISIPPRAVAESLAQHFPIKIFELPEETFTPPVQIKMTWTPRTDKDPIHRWLRQKIRQVLKKCAI